MTLKQSMTASAIVAAMAVPMPALAAQQQPGSQMPGMATPVASAAVTGCAQAQSLAERTIDMTNRRLEAARQANSPAAMRAAMDDMQAALRQLRADIAPCAAMQAAAADLQPGHVMPSTAQAPAMAPGTPVMRPGSTAPAPAAVAPAAPMDHSNMPMGGNAPAAKPGAATAGKPAAPAAPMDHSKMPMPGATRAGKPAAAAPGKPAAPMDHSKMPMGGAAANNAPASKPMPLALAVDRVCGLKVDPTTAPRADYQGQTFHFCSEQHRQLFQKNPAKFAPKEAVKKP